MDWQLITVTDAIEALLMDEPPDTLQEAARALACARESRQRMADLERRLESHVARLMDGRTAHVEGVGTLERRGGKDRRAWDHTLVASRLSKVAVAERKVDPVTGEIEPEHEAVTRVFLDCAQVGYWRAKTLRSYGLDPDDYCETSPGRVSVAITR